MKYIFFAYAFPVMYVTICQHIFHQFRHQNFFSAHILKKLFFFDFSGDNFFIIFFSSAVLQRRFSTKKVVFLHLLSIWRSDSAPVQRFLTNIPIESAD